MSNTGLLSQSKAEPVRRLEVAARKRGAEHGIGGWRLREPCSGIPGRGLGRRGTIRFGW